MDQLTHFVIVTGDLARMKAFYETAVGLAVRKDATDWVEFDTAGATLVLHAVRDPRRRGVQLRFATENLAARVAELASRGLAIEPVGVDRAVGGGLATLRDPERNSVAFWEPAEPPAAGEGPALSVVVNCRDLAAGKHFYRDVLGFPVTLDTAYWVQLSVGDATMGLHPRTDRPGGEGHHARGLTVGLAVPELDAWYGQASARGVRFAAPPANRGFGLFVDASDPDGNALTFREAPESATLAERLAEPFEDDQVPRRAAIRKPVRKGAKAVSRVAQRPRYRKAAPSRRPRPAATPLERVASPRGTGPVGTRQKPKRRHDPKRARTKPALGRLRKAERRIFKSKKRAVARASKSKPVKRASRIGSVRRAPGRGRARP